MFLSLVGWKPGDPISLPELSGVPLPPPGWKPGDPIVFPNEPPQAQTQRPEVAMVKPADRAPENPPPQNIIHVPHIEVRFIERYFFFTGLDLCSLFEMYSLTSILSWMSQTAILQGLLMKND